MIGKRDKLRLARRFRKRALEPQIYK